MSKRTVFLICLLSLEAAAQVHKGLSFQAMIKDPGGNAPTVSGLSVNSKILSTNGCILWEEQFSNVHIGAGHLNLAIGQGTATGHQPAGQTLTKVFSNGSPQTGLTCLDSNGNVDSGTTSYSPQPQDARRLRLEMTLSGTPLSVDFNLRSMPFAVNAENLNGKSEADFLQRNSAQGLTQANAETWFASAVWQDLLNSTYNAPTATTAVNVTGTVGIANGGTGATTAAGARSNLGLGSLATMTPTGTADGTTFLRGDGTWTTVAGGVSSVAGKTGNVTLVSTDLTDFTTAVDTRVSADVGSWKGQPNGLASLDAGGKVPASQLPDPTGSFGSQAQHAVFAAPLASSGAPSFRLLRVSDVRDASGAGPFLNQTGGCPAGQALGHNSVNDTLECQNFVLVNGSVTNAKINDVNVAKITSGSGSYFGYAPNGSACANGDVLKKTANGWECGTDAAGAGTVTSVTSANGDITVGTTTTTPVLTLNSGTSANQIVKLNGSAELPAVSGANLTNLNASSLTSGTLDPARLPSGITDGLWNVSGGNVYRGSGFVGIGTATPGYGLDVVGDINIVNGNWIRSGGSGILRVSGGQTQVRGLSNGLQLLTNTTQPALTIDSSGNVGIGTTTPASHFQVAGGVQIGADAAGCASAKAGTLRYNGGNVEYCNGSSWSAFGVSGSGLQSLNGLNPSSQTLAIGSGGTSPTWNSSGSVHTLDIPMASASSVTAGLLSKTDYDAFTAKLGPATTFAGDVTGTYNATVIANNAVTAVKIADGSVTTAKILDGTVAPADLNFAGSMTTNTGVVVRDGTQFFSKSCGNNQALIWSAANGWSCSNVVLSESDPKIGSITTNYLPKWGGSALVTSVVAESGGKIGIGESAPERTLHVRGTGTSTTLGQLDTGLRLQTTTGTVGAGSEITFRGAATATDDIGTYAAISAPVIANGAAGTRGYLSFSTKANTTDTSLVERMRIDGAGNVGIGVTAPATKLDVAGAVRIGADATACSAGNAGAIRYNGGNVEYCNGSTWAAFGVSGSGLQSLNGLNPSTQTLAIGSSGNSPAWNSSGSVHTLNIPMASASSVTAGLISKTEYNAFNNKLDAVSNTAALASGKIWVGDLGGKAQEQTPGGDVTMTNAGSFTVTKLQGRNVASTAPSLGTYLKWNNTLSQWEPQAFGTCNGASQALHYTAVTDTWTCDTVSVSGASGTLPIANGGTGATTATAALNALLPSQTSQSGKYLTTDGTNASWAGIVATPAGSNGQVQFNNSGSLGASANFFWDNGASRLGIGTTSPWSRLHVSDADSDVSIHVTNTSSTTARWPGMNLYNYTGGNGGGPVVGLVSSRGSMVAPAAVQGGDLLGAIVGRGQYNTTAGNTGQGAAINLAADGLFSASSFPGRISFSTTPAGATLSIERMRIDKDGNVGIGVTAPSQLLDVSGPIRSAPAALPSSPSAGVLAFDSGAANALKYYDGTSWKTVGTGTGSGTVTSVGSGTGLTGGPITTTGALAVDVGTTAGKILQVAAGDKLPVIDGSQLTNLSAAQITAGTLPLARGGTGASTQSGAANAILPTQTSNGGKILQTDGANVAWATPFGSALNSGLVWVGNGSNVPTARSLNISDIRSTTAGAWFAASGLCPTGQSLQYVSAADSVSCQSYSLSSSQVTTALTYTPVNKAGDTMTGALTIATNLGNNDPLKITKTAATDRATVAYVPNGSLSASNATFMTGIQANTNNFSVSSWDGSSWKDPFTIAPSGNVGIGISNAAGKLRVYEVSTNSGGVTTGQSYIQVNPSANQTSNTYNTAFKGMAELTGSVPNQVGKMIGLDGSIYNTTSATVDTLRGTSGWADNSGAGTIAEINGGDMSAQSTAGTIGKIKGLDSWVGVAGGTVSDQYGLMAWVSQSGGTVANRYGLYLGADGTAANDYGVYQASSIQKNYFSGSVGIGVTNPGSKLVVRGDDGSWVQQNIEAYSSSAVWHSPYMVMRRGRGTAASPAYPLAWDQLGDLSFRNYNSGAGAGVQAFATENHTGSASGSMLYFYTTPNGTNTTATGMVIGQNGNVGIGISSPSSKLSLYGSPGNAPMVVMTRGNNTTDKNSLSYEPSGSLSASNVIWSTGVQANRSDYSLWSWDGTTTADRMVVLPSGNVGIGTTNPTAKLDVNGQIKSGFVSHSSLNTNWASGNIQLTSVAAGTLTFTSGSMFDGASYVLILTSPGTFTLSTTGDVSSWKCLPACASNQIIATGHTVLTIIKAGTTGYVSWGAGYQ